MGNRMKVQSVSRIEDMGFINKTRNEPICKTYWRKKIGLYLNGQTYLFSTTRFTCGPIFIKYL